IPQGLTLIWQKASGNKLGSSKTSTEPAEAQSLWLQTQDGMFGGAYRAWRRSGVVRDWGVGRACGPGNFQICHCT
uniref:Uncharacterized protein n=1 Tax=Electrophorus electricus TaxID=8005 RepID=A0A4W4F1J3_ELEEL